MKTLILLFLSASLAHAIDDTKLLNAIAQVETGENRLAMNGGERGAVGMYQVRIPAWTDANAQLKREGKRTYPRSEWRSPEAQDAIAFAYLRVIRARLLQMGIADPTPEVIALCWNQGCGYARSHGFAPNDYAERVGNLARLTK
jgi:hypothetical protein